MGFYEVCEDRSVVMLEEGVAVFIALHERHLYCSRWRIGVDARVKVRLVDEVEPSGGLGPQNLRGGNPEGGRGLRFAALNDRPECVDDVHGDLLLRKQARPECCGPI